MSDYKELEAIESRLFTINCTLEKILELLKNSKEKTKERVESTHLVVNNQNQWISVNDIAPDPSIGRILVFSKKQKIHVLHYDYAAWVLSETDDDFSGEDVDFDYWMLLPNPPNPRQKEFENDIYHLCTLAELSKQAEIAGRLMRHMPHPQGVPICQHDEWETQAHKEKEQFIDEFFKKWGPKDE